MSSNLMKVLLFCFLIFSSHVYSQPATTVTLTPAGFSTLSYQTATDDLGDSVAVWTETVGSAIVLQTATRAAGGTWTPSTPGNPAFQNNGISFNPNLQSNVLTQLQNNVTSFQLAMDRQGNAVVAWVIFNGSNYVIQAAFKPAGGSFTFPGPPNNQTNVISPLGFDVFDLVPGQVAIFPVMQQSFGRSLMVQIRLCKPLLLISVVVLSPHKSCPQIKLLWSLSWGLMLFRILLLPLIT